jgi:hypothetical protein
MEREMLSKILILCSIILLSATLTLAQAPINGMSGNVTLNMRQLPQRNSQQLAQLPPHTEIIVEARSEQGDWVLVRAPLLTLRGWVAIGYIEFDREVRVMDELPVSYESVADPTVMTAGTGGSEIAPIAVIPDNIDYPPVYLDNAVWRNVRQIYARGRQLGNDPWVLMKIGESNTAGTVYLCNFEWRSYSLGTYTHLQQVVDEFSRTGSFCRSNASAQNGFATVNVLDPLFAPSDICEPNESPLACEVRRSRPSFAFIYIGLADTGILTPDEYENNLTLIVNYLSRNGVVPIIQTWPTADGFNTNNRPQIYNEVVRAVAHNTRIPMLDLRAALYNYDNRGTGPDGYHLSVRDASKTELAGDEAIFGRPYRELQSLQILYDLITGLN